ncbi:DNA polymerase III: epsilon subunit, 3-5 exonucleolytic proofreading function [Hyphomicrobium sp. GJ21]|jgi:DNA polymerase-3 subunit epsilon|uniref:DNA polymerase III subunit epsilon n=1 Tax=Hyphomicrobium sp. GJ21 TaxID=113574 RepID=UPI000622B6FC|nr:DNA polymerase III subunit epsilon [Hyphomicrobium sp. GJ21]CEJ83335.1 DNA polymerase III: epsilon subunit, 3-5 exonucleolytic proofreading function [Hyphomicrobium sp. GJ21]
MREIVLDTETTGLDPKTGDRLIEIGGIEIINRIPTGVEFHRFINPERNVPMEAQNVHGISTEFLIGKPLFREVYRDFLAFIGDDILVIHNAQFDVNFLNHELGLVGEKPLSFDRVVDTLALARRRHPAGPNSLDALCKRYGIDTSQRTKHGAIVDSLLLAEVYVELLGERQATFGLQTIGSGAATSERRNGKRAAAKPRPEPLPSRLTEADLVAHRSFIEKMGAKAIWNRFWGAVTS